MRLLFAANTPPDPDLGAPGRDLATIAALRRLGHTVDEIWASDLKRCFGHNNTYQLLELPHRFAQTIRDRCRMATYDVVQVNQPHAYRAARQHQAQNRPGIFVNRSHGWELHVREALAKWGGALDQRPIWRRLCSAVMARLLARHNELVVRYSDGLVLCSNDDRDYVLRHHRIDPDRVLALAPGVAEEYLSEATPVERERFRRLLYVGQFTPIKAPGTVAAIAGEVLEAEPMATLTWVCAAEHHGDARAMLPPSVRDRVTFLGWMPRAQLMKVYDEHGLFIFPSRFEGFALSFLEAMARGLCVLASRIDGMRQLIVHGKNGFVFSPDDVAGFVRQARSLLHHPEECASVSQSARQTALNYTSTRTATELVAFYEHLHRQERARIV